MAETIAILGANSQLAKDLIIGLTAAGQNELLLYVRNQNAMDAWLADRGLAARSLPYAQYGRADHSAVINFVGVGDPQRAAQMGGSIFEITLEFDDLAIADLERNPQRRYVFLSSGAAYGSTFLEPATAATKANFTINDVTPQDYYAVAKLYAEVRHRSLRNMAIADIRVFNYFSRTQSLDARFFITDIVRAIRDRTVLKTSPDFMIRDFLHPADFHALIDCVLAAPPTNAAIDCYSRAPIDKATLLAAMQAEFGLQYEVDGVAAAVNATGQKPHYYSLNRKAAEYGYVPAYSSLEGIMAETKAILSAT